MRRAAAERAEAATESRRSGGRHWIRTLAVLALLGLVLPGARCPSGLRIGIQAPPAGLLIGPGSLDVALILPPGADPASLELLVDGAAKPLIEARVAGQRVTGRLEGLSESGRRDLLARVQTSSGPVATSSWFELVELDRPEQCEILNQVECSLPFPSSRFLAPADTETGFRVEYGPETLPPLIRSFPNVFSLDPTPFLQNDGFSPTVQVLMHFPAGLNPVLSDAPRIDPVSRTFGERGLDPDSPTLLIEWQRGDRVNHWIENDSHGFGPSTTLTFLRPGEGLKPGHRYVVAVRNLVDDNGDPLEAEPVFAAIRDKRPSTIPAVEERREQLEPILNRLASQGVAREELVIAFDFVVQSDHSLTHEMLSMRDQSFAWFAAQQAAGVQTFRVDSVDERNPDCADPEEAIWRIVEGSFQVPLFLDGDPFLENDQPSFLQRDSEGVPAWSTLTDAPYGIAIPCSVFDESGAAAGLPPLLVGHGLFGTGAGTVSSISGARGVTRFDYVSGGTNWSGLSGPDIANFLNSFIVKLIVNQNDLEALPDRLRQGQANTLLLGRMLKQGAFNAAPTFQDETGNGVIASDEPLYYFGASLGGIMGTMFAALTPDTERLNVDVPAINFSLLLQRATPFVQFEQLLDFVNNNPLQQAIGISLNHELWVRGEPAGYAGHITSDPLPGSIPKRMLVTAALYDQQVSNLGSQLLARTLRLGELEGSVMNGLPGIPETTGPQDSGFIVYDTASFDLDNPDHLPFVPPLVNEQAESNQCDPHGRRAFIPASISQLLEFLTPDGQIHNFCTDDGICNASEPNEIPFGESERCQPLD